MVPVLMVHRKEVPVHGIELSPAFGADQAMDPQGLLPVVGVGRGSNQPLQFPDDLFGAFPFRGLVRLGFSDFYPLPVSQSGPPSEAYLILYTFFTFVFNFFLSPDP